MRPGEHLGVLQYCLEAYEGMSAWVIGQFMRREELLEGGRLTRVDAGPHVQTYRWTCALGETKLELDISLARRVPRIDFELHVDWREVGDRDRGIPNLRVRFPLDLSSPEAAYEIPFGAIRRDRFNGEEVPAQRWVDLSEGDGQGVTLVNTSKYGFSVEGSTLNMTLLRSSIDPDPLPDLGEHVIRYALVPHGIDWADGASTRVGEELNVPLVITSSDFHTGDLPSAAALISVQPDNVRLAALKKSEDGTGFVLRLVEMEGESTEARVTFSPEVLGAEAKAVEVDLLERAVAPERAAPVGKVLTVSVPAFGITSVRVSR